jgi:2'-hydroxyisoflavone reductase
MGSRIAWTVTAHTALSHKEEPMSAARHIRRGTIAVMAALFAIFSAGPGSAAPAPAKKPLKILILGGTGFLGPATIDAALARGHHVTMFNRGKTRPELYPQVARLHGDRDPKKDSGLKELEGGRWDVVMDNSGYYPRHVAASAALLADRCKHYIYISSISAYREPNPVNGDEDAPLATMADPNVEEMGKEYENFGPLKALCEKAAQAAMPGRTTIVRPGYIVGPDDPSGRFTYWPVRFDRGGKVLVPGSPSDSVQFIDVRDLGEWLVKLAEDGTMGVFTATGPASELRWGDFIGACLEASGADPKPKALWVGSDTIIKAEALGQHPIWIAPVGHYAGFHNWSNERAVKAGLRFRPYADTVRDTLAWYRGQEKVENGRTRLAEPSKETEAKILEIFKKDLLESLGQLQAE